MQLKTIFERTSTVFNCLDIIMRIKRGVNFAFVEKVRNWSRARCGPHMIEGGRITHLLFPYCLKPLRYSDRRTLISSSTFSWSFSGLQSLGTDEGVRMLVKTVFFYIAITLEAFIFCFSGEYLSNKVSIWNHRSKSFYIQKKSLSYVALKMELIFTRK